MKIITNEEKLYQYLRDKYNRIIISKKELAQELGVCKSTIDHAIIKNEDMPPFKKLGKAKNARVVFNIVDVAKFLDNTIATNV